MSEMRNGKFLGIEDGMVKIERPDGSIYEYQYCGKCRSTKFHFGKEPNGWERLPTVGEEVKFDSPGPDGAGNIMLDVYPSEG